MCRTDPVAQSTEQQKIQVVDTKKLFAFKNSAVRDFVNEISLFNSAFWSYFLLCKTESILLCNVLF